MATMLLMASGMALAATIDCLEGIYCLGTKSAFQNPDAGHEALGEADAILSENRPFGPRIGLPQHLKWRF